MAVTPAVAVASQPSAPLAVDELDLAPEAGPDSVPSGEPKAESRPGRSRVVRLAKAGVWAGVALCCMMPVLWFLFMVVTSFRPAAAQPNPVFGPGFGPEPGGLEGASLFTKLASSMFMLGAMFYASWCAVGVVCGLGRDRAIDVYADVFALLRRDRRG